MVVCYRSADDRHASTHVVKKICITVCCDPVFRNLSLMMRKMKPGEKLVFSYLESVGYTNIQYEPVPNCPPDFVIDGEIAIEARRLNEIKHSNGVNIPLEDLEFGIMPRVIKLIRSFDRIPSEKTAFISVSYQRPLKVDKMLIDKIMNVLNEHLNRLDEAVAYDVTPRLQFRCRPNRGSIKYNKPFVWASSSDNDSGFVVGNIYRSLKIIITEKEKKILPFKDAYPTWWLAVTDKIGYGLTDMDIDQLREGFDIKTFFERIIFISPLDAKDGNELILKP